VGKALAIREWGAPGAPIVVFLHGLGLIGPRATDEPAQAWAARGFHVVAPDLPGFGGSEPLSRGEYRPSRLARLLLEQLPEEQFALVGYSWGGTIGSHLTAAAPERVKALVLVDVGYSAPEQEPPSYDDLLEEGRTELSARFPDEAAFLEFARPHFSERLSDEALVGMLREVDGELAPDLTAEVYAAGAHGFHEEPPVALHGALREARIPILLLVAGRPPNERRDAEVAAFALALPEADILHFPESGHNVLLDAADEAIPAVGEWLSRSLLPSDTGPAQ
jgi:pimeloyl-ACP methyl ester carboxylesterase